MNGSEHNFKDIAMSTWPTQLTFSPTSRHSYINEYDSKLSHGFPGIHDVFTTEVEKRVKHLRGNSEFKTRSVQSISLKICADQKNSSQSSRLGLRTYKLHGNRRQHSECRSHLQKFYSVQSSVPGCWQRIILKQLIFKKKTTFSIPKRFKILLRCYHSCDCHLCTTWFESFIK